MKPLPVDRALKVATFRIAFALALAALLAFSAARGGSAGTKTPMAFNDPSLAWEKPVKVTRKPKKYQVIKPKRGTQTTPVLSLRMWVLKRDKSLKPVTTSPTATFQIEDRLQLVAQTNQNGYLYLVQNETADDVSLLFPDSRINDGQNYVRKEQKIVIPSNCPEEFNDENGSCWWKVTDKDDELTVIFSREMLLDIPNQLSPNTKSVKVRRRTVTTLLGENQNLQQVILDNRYQLQFWNANRANNEILVAKITLKHQ